MLRLAAMQVSGRACYVGRLHGCECLGHNDVFMIHFPSLLSCRSCAGALSALHADGLVLSSLTVHVVQAWAVTGQDGYVWQDHGDACAVNAVVW
jgi:hypothetical protein